MQWLTENSSLRRETKKEKGRNRLYVVCTACEQQKEAASKLSANGVVYAASGMLADSTEKLRRAVDHLLGRPHHAAVQAQKLCHMWHQQSDRHPWLHTLKRHDAETIKTLVRLAVDVYSDSKLEMVSARSWPCRSLAVLHSDRLLSRMADEGWECAFLPTMPTAAETHYRYPVIYRDMLQSVADVETEKLATKLKAGVCFSLQIDGSVDRQQVDTKFVTARTVTADGQLMTLFLGVGEADSGGAEGLMEVTKATLDRIQADTSKLMGITTDGEAANTGRNSGLWQRLQEHISHKVLTMWCTCHRSDLAMESVEASVPELSHWKTDVTAVATYFRASKSRTKRLKEAGAKLSFPAHFEVRFAEHLLQLIGAVLENLPACRQVWQDLATEGENQKARAEAKGFATKWVAGGRVHFLTAVMHDVTKSVTFLQKKLQADDLIVTDVLDARDATVDHLSTMERAPAPGGAEEKVEPAEENRPRRATPHELVTKSGRSMTAIRGEIIGATKNFLGQRLNIDQERQVKVLLALLTAESAEEFVNEGRTLVAELFGEEFVSDFAVSAFHEWARISEAKTNKTRGEALKAMVAATTGVCQKLLAAFLSLTPHSMGTERAVSHYNLVKTSHRLATHVETVQARMLISLNGVGIGLYDPRLAVADFLRKKQRRAATPKSETYARQDFVKKFFDS